MRRVAVIGAGWAGLAAAVAAVGQGAQVSLFDMAQAPGGRARALGQDGLLLDNGQHILIGAYAATLALMRRVGVVPEQALMRLPLTLAYPDGSGLRLPPGPPVLAFLRGVLGWRDRPWSERLQLLGLAARWRWQGFACPPEWTVAQLCADAPAGVMADLIDPLSVAALNTPAHQASAQVLLTVLRDALFGGSGSADLLLPRVPLSELLPNPAATWLAEHGAHLHWGQRVQTLSTDGAGWQVDGAPFDQVVLAASASEAARLTQTVAPAWSAMAAALSYQPIITVWLLAPGARWPQPMMALRAGPDAPAQFGFDLGALQQRPDTFALVISGAADWVQQGLPACAQAVRQQLARAFAGTGLWPADAQVSVLAMRAEKRATFACSPQLKRPPRQIAPGLAAAGDYIEGPYPATLEGAVRSGEASIAGLF